MNSMTLAIVAAVCGALAIYLWTAQSKLNDEIKRLRDEADKARADARKEADRAEAARKKADAPRDGGPAKEDKAAKELKAQAVAAKEEVKRLHAALKRAEQEDHETQIKLRRAEARVEELAAALQMPSKKAVAAPAPQAPPPVPEPVRAEPVELADDPQQAERAEQAALRRAELEAERAARQAEAEQARTEREAARAARQESKDQEFIAKLLDQREHLKHLVFQRELELRILDRKQEHNRQAYIMTMGALELAEDELYRLKHGRERPDWQPPAGYGEEGEEDPGSQDHGAAELGEDPGLAAPAPDFAASDADRAAARSAADAALAQAPQAAEPAQPAEQPQAEVQEAPALVPEPEVVQVAAVAFAVQEAPDDAAAAPVDDVAPVPTAIA